MSKFISGCMASRCTQTPLERTVNPVKRLFGKVLDKGREISGIEKVAPVVANFSGYSDERQGNNSDSESNLSDQINQPAATAQTLQTENQDHSGQANSGDFSLNADSEDSSSDDESDQSSNFGEHLDRPTALYNPALNSTATKGKEVSWSSGDQTSQFRGWSEVFGSDPNNSRAFQSTPKPAPQKRVTPAVTPRKTNKSADIKSNIKQSLNMNEGSVVLLSLPKVEKFGDHPDQDWANWVKGFQRTCAAFGLTFSRMAAVIHMYLEDKALMDYEELEKTELDLRDWEVVLRELGKKFKARKSNFRNLVVTLDNHPKIKSGQSISSYYGELVTIIDKRFKDLPLDERQHVLKSALLRGLTNQHLLDEIAKKGAYSLDQILKVARKWETLQTDKIIEDLQEDKVKIIQAQAGEQAFLEAAKALQTMNREQIEMAQRSQSRNLQPRNFGGNFNRMSRPGCCFVCGDPSHYKRDCPQFRPRGGYQNFGRGWRGPPSYGQQFRPQSGFHQTHQVNHVGQYPNASGNDFDAGYKKGLEDAAKKVAEHESLVRNVNAACEEKGDESYWFFNDSSNGRGQDWQPTRNNNSQVNMVSSWTLTKVSSKGSNNTSLLSKVGQAMLRNASWIAKVMLLMMIITNTPGVGGQGFDDYSPEHPVLCDSVLDMGQGQLWKWPERHQCKSVEMGNINPQNMTLRLYKRNMIEWKSEAYQCQKFKSKVSTIVSFFTDSKSINKSTEMLPVGQSECINMARTLTCSAGNLIGDQGVYITKNEVNYEFDWCCSYDHFEATNCAVIKTHVYKRFGSVLESPAGDVRKCRYEDEVCTLEDGTVLVWSVNNNASCEYLYATTLKGKYAEGYFITDTNDLALTFKNTPLVKVTTCDNKEGVISDQGLIVSFENAINQQTVEAAVSAELGLTPQSQALFNNDKVSGTVANIVNGMVQAVYVKLSQLITDAFRKSINYACHALAEYLEMIKGLIQAHPTATLRYIFENPNIFARTGNGVIEVFSCTQLDPGSYKLLPMNDTCTEWIPIQFTYANTTHKAYLDYITNTIVPTSPERSCHTTRKLPVSLGGVISMYVAKTGALEKPGHVNVLQLTKVNLNESMLEIPEVIYRSATLIDWSDMMQEHSLNDVLAAAAKQRRVLNAMGITWEGEPGAAATENLEHIFERGFFGFLLGAHLGSPFEVYVFLVCLWVTVVTVAKLLQCICQCRNRGVREVVRQVKPGRKRTRNRVVMVNASDLKAGELEAIEEEVAPLRYPKLYPDLSKIDMVNSTGGILHVPIQLQGINVLALWDSGSSISLIGSGLVKKLDLPLCKTNLKAAGVTGDKLVLSGEATVKTKLGPNILNHDFAVMDNGKTEVILGTDYMERIGPYLVDIEHQQLKLKNLASGEITPIDLIVSGQQ